MKFREVSSDKDNLAFQIRLYLCGTSSIHLNINCLIPKEVGRLFQREISTSNNEALTFRWELNSEKIRFINIQVKDGYAFF